MKNNSVHYIHPTGLAFGLTAGIIYSLCAAIVAVWPAQSVSFFSSWFHGIDLTKIAATPDITAGSFAVGLVSIILFAYITGAVYAWAYNACTYHCKKLGWI